MHTSGFYITGAPHPATQALCNHLKSRPDVHFVNGPILATSPETSPSALGFYAPGLLSSDGEVASILDNDPGAKFVICIDNPVNVAWCLHQKNLKAGIEPVSDFQTAWSMSSARRAGRGIKPEIDGKLLDYTAISAQGQQIVRLRCRVAASAVHVIFTEDLLNVRTETWESLEAFLGLDPLACPASFGPKPSLKDHARKLFNRPGRHEARILSGASMIPGPRPTRAAERAVSERLSEDIATLSVLTGRDLSHWLS